MKRIMGRCISLSILTCLVFILSSFSRAFGDDSTIQINLFPVDTSSPQFNDTGDQISSDNQEAWFAFDLSSIPQNAQVISAAFSAYMWNMSYTPGWRSLWYYSNDSWIFKPDVASSDPGDYVIADKVVGTLWHNDSPDLRYIMKSIEINYDGWANDIADGYISLMLTGGPSGVVGTAPDYTMGIFYPPVLSLTITTSAQQPITITSPNGGESWQAGTGQTITWDPGETAGTSVKIELYQNNVYLSDIVASTANDGSYTWQIPSGLSSNSTYRVKIIDTGNSSIYDYSNGYFSIISQTPPQPDIYPPQVNTLSPINVTDSNVTLRGQIISDGYAQENESCSWRFSFCKYVDQSNVMSTDWECCTYENQIFSLHLEGLEPDTVYLLMAEAANSAGAGQGNVITFTTLPKVVDPNNLPPASYDPDEINTLLIQNFVKQFQTDADAPHAHQGLLTYVEKSGNFSRIDSNDTIYVAPAEKSSKIVSLIPKKNSEGDIISFYTLSKDARPWVSDINDPNNNVVLELSIYDPGQGELNISSENYLKFWIENNAFEGKPVTIQQFSSDPNIECPVWDIRNIINENNRKLPLDYILTDPNQAPGNSKIAFKIMKPEIPYVYFSLSTSRQIADIDNNGTIDLNDQSLLLADLGKVGKFRTDIASLKDNKIVLGIPDGKVDVTDSDAFLEEYNKKNNTSFFEGFENAAIQKPFTTTGSSQWTIDTNPYKGSFCARSGHIGDNQSSILQATIESTNGEISFWRKVSSEWLFDELIFYIDGIEKEKWSGLSGWQKITYQIAPGTHTFKWEYRKDNSYSAGEDAAWIDDISVE